MSGGQSGLEIISDVGSYVRRRPGFFFRGDPTLSACVWLLLRQAAWLGLGDVEVARSGAWVVVSSATDWFDPLLSDNEHVTRLLPLPDVGMYAFRAESIVAAVSQSAATRLGGAPWRRLVGDGSLSDLDPFRPVDNGRAFAFLHGAARPVTAPTEEA